MICRPHHGKVLIAPVANRFGPPCSKPHLQASGMKSFFQKVAARFSRAKSGQGGADLLAPIEAKISALEALGKKIVDHVKALNDQTQNLKKTVADLTKKAGELKRDFDQVNDGKNPETAALLASRGKAIVREKKKLEGEIGSKESEFNDFLQKWLQVQINVASMSKGIAQARTEAENSSRRGEIIEGLKATLSASKASTEEALRTLGERAAAQNAIIESLVKEQVAQREGIALPQAVSTSDLFEAARAGGLDV